jgi:C1A family cysteine protease
MRFLPLLLLCAFAARAEQLPNYPVIGKTFHTGLIHEPREMKPLGKMHFSFADCENLPDTFDLRDLGVVPDVRNQGSCGSCWAFSKTASLESALLAGGGAKLDLSEQQLVSCDQEQYGCNGGMLSDFNFQIKKGQALESDFPTRRATLIASRISNLQLRA